ncbi:unnamed protein product [Phytophthora fragariaefolia]|uniref:Unnamed protein product n=1 Tax=Phytophthora fragariaefolia TaxID=1490495 RepID=A0A9W7D474_9STRA|nr:unnamed protein product [Phytophthora fragariaefolia]
MHTTADDLYSCLAQTQIMDDLGTAVEAAEKEFRALNKRYKDLVAQMEANNRRGASTSDNGKGNSSSAQLSQALGPLLDELEAKAKQLNLLKQVYQQASTSTINPRERGEEFGGSDGQQLRGLKTAEFAWRQTADTPRCASKQQTSSTSDSITREAVILVAI